MIIFPSYRLARRRNYATLIAGTGANGALVAGRGRLR
jgi:hypothetical protein